MENLVSILTGSIPFFLGLLALLVTFMAIGNFVTLYWLRRDLGALEYEVYSLDEKINRAGPAGKKRKKRGRKQAGKPSTSRVKEKRAKGEREHSLLD